MGAHLLRTVPNTAIMFLTYEFVVWLVEGRNRGATFTPTIEEEELISPSEAIDEE
jgi:hypothetical protein